MSNKNEKLSKVLEALHPWIGSSIGATALDDAIIQARTLEDELAEYKADAEMHVMTLVQLHRVEFQLREAQTERDVAQRLAQERLEQLRLAETLLTQVESRLKAAHAREDALAALNDELHAELARLDRSKP